MKKKNLKGRYIDINTYFIIESLMPDEVKTGRNLYSDSVRRRVEQLGLQAIYYDVNSKQEFFEKLLGIENYITQGCIPYIHFEIHGSKEGFHMNNGDFVSWDEFSEFAIRINTLLCNQLIMSLATCYGGYMFKILDPLKRAPFLAFIAPMKSESSNDLEIDFLEYFERLLTEKDFSAALDYMFSPNARIKYFFMTSTALFEKLNMMNHLASDKKAFKNIWSQVTGKPRAIGNRRASRDWLKNNVKNRAESVRQYRDHFLMKDLKEQRTQS